MYVTFPRQLGYIGLTRTRGRTPWGLFGNVFPGEVNRRDRAIVGPTLHVHTPWVVLELSWT